MNNPVAACLVEEKLTEVIIGAFYRVYNKLGFGFLEHVYAAAMERELLALGLRVARECWVRIHYDGVELCQQRLDFVVNEKVVIEIKSTAQNAIGWIRRHQCDRLPILDLGAGKTPLSR